jgi:hypothetical protein
VRPVAGILAAAAAAAAFAAPAHAGSQMEVGIADDAVLLGDPAKAEQAVAKWKGLGIETVRVFARWVAIAPEADSVGPPSGFRAADPADPLYSWGVLDRAIALLRSHGITPVVVVTGSGPLWSSRLPGLGVPRYKPDPSKFAAFAAAVATRYRDSVDRYVLWNEPNIPGWMQPQFTCTGSRCTPESPHVYRALVNAAYPAIKQADPRSTVLMGALAPRGGRPVSRNVAMRPLQFIRALGCVDERYRRIRTGPCRNFKPVRADGFAYHPHGVLRSPDEPAIERDNAAIADLGRLGATLDKTTRAGGFKPSTGRRFHLYLTEYGYQTRPPDPYAGISPSAQARWIQHGAYLAWRDPRVKCVMQYEWRDEPIASRGLGARAFSGWQSGLLFADGRGKPALDVFPDPFWADMRSDTSARLWGQVRPGGAHTVHLLRRSRPGAPWRRFWSLSTDGRGYFTRQVRITQSAQYRYSYELPSGDPYRGPITQYSATLTVRPRTGVVPVKR